MFSFVMAMVFFISVFTFPGLLMSCMHTMVTVSVMMNISWKFLYGYPAMPAMMRMVTMSVRVIIDICIGIIIVSNGYRRPLAMMAITAMRCTAAEKC